MCSVGTVLFTALGISVAAIALHGSFRVPDDLFTDEIEVTQLPTSMHKPLTADIMNSAASHGIPQRFQRAQWGEWGMPLKPGALYPAIRCESEREEWVASEEVLGRLACRALRPTCCRS